MSARWIVHKFGGTSLADAERYRAACEIVLSQRSGERVAVVVSAMSGVTSSLIEAANLAAVQDDSYLEKLQSLENRHLQTIAELKLQTSQGSVLEKTVVSDLSAIKEVLRGVRITRLASERIIEFVSGHGELWSAQLLHAYLKSGDHRSEEHTSELQSRLHLVCRLLLEKKKKKKTIRLDISMSTLKYKSHY